MKTTFLAFAAILLFCSVQARAADVTLFTGYLNPGNVNLSTIFSRDLQVRGTGVYGASLEADYRRIIGLEESVAFSPRLFTSNLIPNETDVRGFLYSSNLVVNAPLSRLVPYATMGIGMMKPWGTGFKPFGTRFAFNYGGGVKLQRLLGPIGLRFEVRGYTIPDVASENLNIFEASGGLTISIGGGR
jgi:hypothetical protein